MKKKAVWSLAGAGVLAVAFAVWWRLGGFDLSEPPPSPPLQDVTVPDAPSAQPAALPSLATGEEALPRLDAPLATTLPELRRLAGRGHARAACRLAAEIERCATVSALRQEHDLWLAERGRALELAKRVDDPAVIQVRTEEELREVERANILAVLNKARWKVYGRHGAAELLGIKPGTLAARMKKLGLRRPS